jgi:hypothetical protein
MLRRVASAYGFIASTVTDSITREGLNEAALASSATGDGWNLSLPCAAADLEWTQRKLKSLSARVTARVEGEDCR